MQIVARCGNAVLTRLHERGIITVNGRRVYSGPWLWASTVKWIQLISLK